VTGHRTASPRSMQEWEEFSSSHQPSCTPRVELEVSLGQVLPVPHAEKLRSRHLRQSSLSRVKGHGSLCNLDASLSPLQAHTMA
jgi:hypothetical protein